MKKVTVTIFATLYMCLLAYGQDCLPQGISFTTQGQVDSFQIMYPGCQHIGGTVRIESNVVNLNGLSGLQSIGGHLVIYYAQHLHTLLGLDNLQQVGESVSITYNDSLINLTGLQALQSINGGLAIDNNKSLTSLTGLEQLHHIGNYFYLDWNAALTSLANLDHLHDIGGLTILDNALTNLDGLDSLVTVAGDLHIGQDELLTDVSALSHLETVGRDCRVALNAVLTNLNGLQHLHRVGRDLIISGNPLLEDVSALGNLDSIGLGLYVRDNTSLDNCSVFAVCKSLLHWSNPLLIINNATGCNNVEEVEQNCANQTIIATVSTDYDGDCQADTFALPAQSVAVYLSGPVQRTLRSTQADGVARFGYLDSGPFTLSLPQYPNANWQVCQDTLSFLSDTTQHTIHASFVLQPVAECPELTVDLELPPFFRSCLVTTPIQINTNNAGTVVATAARVAIVLPAPLELVSATPPVTVQSGDTLFFDIGDLLPLQTSPVNLVVKTDCGVNLTDQEAICLEAFASWTNPCSVLPSSEIIVSAQCLNDTTVRFTLKNVGNAATQHVHDYVIIEDEVILCSANFHLNAQESMTVDKPSNGATYRMEATKYDDGTLTATALENCGGFTPGFITAYWLNEGLRAYDFDCREIRIAYDPNQKTAIPTGVGPEHLLAANKSIQYTIEFQNTGQDTAFRVVLHDVLSPQLDVSTFRPGASSHPYTWQIVDLNTLEVLFQPIMLPDSNVNAAASHGWFSFEIAQKPDLPDGSVIENTADIVFDYNPPIITNTVQHTIGKLTVSVDEPQDAGSLWQVLSNPAHYAATFRSTVFIPGEKRFELVDAMGRIVRTEHFSGQSFEFRRNNLSGGLYYFRIYDAHGKAATGKIIFSE